MGCPCEKSTQPLALLSLMSAQLRRSFGMPGRYWGDEVDDGLASRPELRSRERARTTAVAAAAFAWTEATWSGNSGRLSGAGASPVPPMSGGRRPKARVRAPRRHEPAVAVARASAHPARAGSRPPGRLCSTRRRAGSTKGTGVAAGRQRTTVPGERRRCSGPGGATGRRRCRRCGCGRPNPYDRDRSHQETAAAASPQPTRRRGSPSEGQCSPTGGWGARPASAQRG